MKRVKFEFDESSRISFEKLIEQGVALPPVIKNAECQVCKGNGGVETIVLFGTSFVVCAYCRHDALETLEMSYTWERREERKPEKSSAFGHAVVFDGGRELIRRGFGIRDHG